jgi:amino acid transporter
MKYIVSVFSTLLTGLMTFIIFVGLHYSIEEFSAGQWVVYIFLVLSLILMWVLTLRKPSLDDEGKKSKLMLGRFPISYLIAIPFFIIEYVFSSIYFFTMSYAEAPTWVKNVGESLPEDFDVALLMQLCVFFILAILILSILIWADRDTWLQQREYLANHDFKKNTIKVLDYLLTTVNDEYSKTIIEMLSVVKSTPLKHSRSLDVVEASISETLEIFLNDPSIITEETLSELKKKIDRRKAGV